MFKKGVIKVKYNRKIVILTLFVALISVVLFGCTNSSEEPNEKLGIRGFVMDITLHSNGGNILVEGQIEEDTDYDCKR